MSHSEHEGGHGSRSESIIAFLERGDGLAHVCVALLLLLLAVGVLIFSTINFVGNSLHPLDPSMSSSQAFVNGGVGYLSDILLGVIILELLSTILTYIQARNLEATIKDFLVVALISSIRKILLVGAQSSVHAESSASDFKTEAWGTVISIVGILLLIGGLILLDHRMRTVAKERAEAERLEAERTSSQPSIEAD